MRIIKKLLERKIKEMEFYYVKAKKSSEKAPIGSLGVSYSNGVEQFYHRTEEGQHKGTYISKDNKKLISALAQKHYDQIFLKTAENNMTKLKKALKSLPDKELIEIYDELSQTRREWVKPYILTDEQYIEQWLNVQYEGKEFDSNTPMLITERGEKVRSKTEKILADKLFAMGIPYRYEYPVRLKGYGFVYPDFTLLNIAKRKEIYLEHFGMMDKIEYCHKAIKKLENYANNEIYLGKNLLVTFETSQYPLNMKTVEEMLREFVMK